MTLPKIERKPRTLKPRPPVTAAPLVVSDLTSFDILGLTGGQLRELLRQHPECPRSRVGQRVLVRVEHILALLDRLATNDGEIKGPAGLLTDEPADVAAVLARVGMRKTA